MFEDDKKKADDPEYMIKIKVSLMLSRYIDHEPSDDIKVISEYFKYISDHIIYRKLAVDVSSELLNSFESICLVMRDRLTLYPDAVKADVIEILEKEKLQKLFGTLSALDENDMRLIRRLNSYSSLARFMFGLFKRQGPEPLVSGDKFGITEQNLLGTKIALNRIAGILNYASELEFLDYELDSEDIRDHYDPNILDKNKLYALINIIKVQAKSLPDNDIQSKIFDRVTKLEEEIRRPRPRWKRIIAGFFILYGFIGNLKTINPDLYGQIYNTTEKIVMIMHTDGLVRPSQSYLYLPITPNSGKELLMPKEIEIKEDE